MLPTNYASTARSHCVRTGEASFATYTLFTYTAGYILSW